MDPTKGKGAPLQLLPFRPQPMPTSTRAALCVPTVGKCNEGGGGAQSAAHRHAATQEQTKPPPTLLTSPPHITLLKNTHKQTKKKKERTGNGKHCAGMPSCNRQRDSHTQKELPRQHQTARLDTEKEKKRETSSSFSIKAPRPLSLPLVGYPPSTSSMQHKFSRVAETAVSAPTRLIDLRQ